jgi:signal transduction histidine kinase
VAVAVAFYYADSARRSWQRVGFSLDSAGSLERELAGVMDETMPALVTRLQQGEPADQALAGVPAPASAPLRRLVQAAALQIAAAERRAAGEAALRTSLESEAERLASQTLPSLTSRLRDGEPVDAVLDSAGLPASGPLQRLLTTTVREIANGERRGAAAMAACASAAARVQAQTTRALAELRDLEHRYGDDKVFGDLLEFDHRISQMGRLADSIALLAGGRSGRRWTKPIVMESILRGAMGRIEAYRRVRVHSASTAAIAGFAAEGVMHTLAELLDNAATFSAHGSEVHVYVEEEDAGIVITIEDSGLGMRKRERSRAEALVSEARDLTGLPGTRLGLAVVGRLAGRYGLTVNFRPSSRGGTGAVVMVPRQLVTQVRDSVPAAAAGSQQTQAAPARVPALVPGDSAAPAADGTLPRRPPGATLAAASHRSSPGPAAAPAPADTPARFAAFRQASSGRHSSPAGHEADGQH